ncbi:MAG: rubrerythrin family protein [Bellilinea sp.]
MTKTLDNLQVAFAGESQANRKYTAFAQKADAEGQSQIARLFRAAAHAETVHALAHFRAMEGVGNTLTNLQAAINGEHYEVVEMYPPFIKDAEAEGERRALRSFSYAWEVEKTHENLYREALALLEEGKKEEDEYDYYVCPVCGHTHKRNAPEVCPVCGAPGSRFEKVA